MSGVVGYDIACGRVGFHPSLAVQSSATMAASRAIIVHLRKRSGTAKKSETTRTSMLGTKAMRAVSRSASNGNGR